MARASGRCIESRLLGDWEDRLANKTSGKTPLSNAGGNAPAKENGAGSIAEKETEAGVVTATEVTGDSGPTKHILVADDEASIRMVLRELLEEEGFRVSEAE